MISSVSNQNNEDGDHQVMLVRLGLALDILLCFLCGMDNSMCVALVDGFDNTT